MVVDLNSSSLIYGLKGTVLDQGGKWLHWQLLMDHLCNCLNSPEESSLKEKYSVVSGSFYLLFLQKTLKHGCLTESQIHVCVSFYAKGNPSEIY